ncbi:hypothetical protein ACBJ59_20330 [Nonomuraea sp. MTCD27]
MGMPGCGLIATAGPPGGRRITPGSSRHDGTFRRGYDMGRPGIATIIAFATLGGGWAASVPAADAAADAADPAPAAAGGAPSPAPASAGHAPRPRAVTGPGDAPGPAAHPRPAPRSGPRPGAGPGPDAGPRAGDPVMPPSPGPADLRIVQSVTPDPVVIGAEAVHTLTVTNTGGQDAGDVTVTDLLDRNLTPGHLPAGCSRTDRTVTCGGPGLTVPAGQSVTYEVPVTTDPALPEGTPLTSRVQVTGGDETRFVTQTRTMADVEILKSGPSAAMAGDTITYTVTVTNHGPSQARDVLVRDHTASRIADRPAECTGDGPALICPIGALAPDESRTFTFAVTPDAAGTFESCATVHTGSQEEDTSGNRSCAGTEVEPAPAPAPAEPATPRAEERKDGHVRREGPAEKPARDQPRAAPAPAAGQDVPPPAHHTGRSLPLTGVSVWMLGLGVAVLLAIGLLVRYFSRRDDTGRTP